MNEDFDIKGDLNFGDVGFDIGDIDSSLFEVDFDGGDQIETRYVRPTLKPIKESQILYSNAEKLAKEIEIAIITLGCKQQTKKGRCHISLLC